MLPNGWKLGDFGSIGKWTGGGTPSKANDSFWMGGTIPWVSPKDMTSGKICDTEDHITPEAIKNSATRLYPSGSVMIVTRSGILRKKLPVAIAESPVTVNQDLKVLPYDKQFSPEYVYNYILCFNSEILNVCAKDGTTVESIDTNSFLNFPVKLPPLPEQKKIAAILSTWDRAIEGTEKLLANSQQQKKALMQQLLTGKKRLPGFTGEWKTLTFKKIAQLTKGSQLNRLDCVSDGTFPVINGGITPSGYTNEANRAAGTITISEGGNSCGYVDYQKEKFWCGGHCYSVEQPKIFIGFLYQTLKFSQPSIMRLRVGSGLPNIQKKSLESLLIHHPIDTNEQKAIAAVLTTADEEITTLESDLSRLRQEKKALMQQLLTGKRRVRVD